MHQIKRVVQVDYYLEVFFDDGSVRAINLLPYLKIAPENTAFDGLTSTRKVALHPEAHSLTWDDGSEITADFLYNNSLLIGRWEGHVANWRRSIRFSTAEVKVEIRDDDVHSCLLLDGKRYPALLISSGWFGLHENIAWYDVPFPGDGEDGEEDVPELEEPQIVFDTLKQLTEMVNRALEARANVTLDITELLLKTGCDLYVGSISPRNAAICTKRFKKNAA